MALFTADTTTAASNAKPTYQPSATNPSFRVPLFSLSMILSHCWIRPRMIPPSIKPPNTGSVKLSRTSLIAPRASWANPRSVYDADMTVRNNFFPVKFLILLLFVRFDSSVIVFSFLPGTDTYTGENESPFFAQGQCISVSFSGLQGDGRQQPAVCVLLKTDHDPVVSRLARQQKEGVPIRGDRSFSPAESLPPARS